MWHGQDQKHVDAPAGDVMGEPLLPVGIPLHAVVRVDSGRVAAGPLDATPERIAVDGSMIKLGSSELDTYSFETVYPESATNEMVQQQVQIMLQKLVDGINVSVISMGQTGSGKESVMDGDIGKNNGVIALSVENLFGMLEARMANDRTAAGVGNGSRYDTRKSSYTVEVSYFEVYNDVIHDLFEPSTPSAELAVELGDYGMDVVGLVPMEVRHAHEFHSLFVNAQEHRVHSSTEFGPLRERSSTFLVIDLEQRMASRNFERLHSRCTFLTLPGTERLALDRTAVETREGGRLNRELFGVKSLIDDLVDPQHKDFANYHVSKTTTLLDDVIGGNALTLCIASILPQLEHAAATRACLEYATKMTHITNYPVVNDEHSMGMFRKLRLQIFNLQDQLAGAEAAGLTGSHNDQGDQETKIVKLQADLVKSQLMRARLVQERKELDRSYGDFRTKYQTLVKQHAEVNGQLFAAEEQRLKLSKRLIDLQIENTDLKEQALSEKYELEAKLLTIENEKVEKDVSEQKRTEQNEALQQQVATLIQEKKELTLEYVALKHNFQSLRQELDESGQKNQDMGGELLTLVNTKNVLEEREQKARAEADALRKLNTELAEYKKTSQTRIQELEQTMIALTAENDRLKLEGVRKDVELAKAASTFESEKTALEKNYITLAMEKDSEVTGLRDLTDKEHARLTELQAKHEKSMAAKQRELKLAKRQLEQLQAQLLEMNQEGSGLRADVARLQQQLTHESESHRAKLVSYMTQIQNQLADLSAALPEQEDEAYEPLDPLQIARGVERRPRGKAGRDFKQDGRPAEESDALRAQIAKLYDEMIQTHNRREHELQKQADSEIQKNTKLTRTNRELASQYRALRAVLMDLAPEEEERVAYGLLSEKELQDLIAGPDQQEERAKVETDNLREEVRELRVQLDQSKQVSLAQAENYQRSSASLQKEYIRLKDAYGALQKTHANCGKGVDRSVLDEHKRSLEQLQNTLESKFMEKLESLQRSNAEQREWQAQNRSAGGGVDNILLERLQAEWNSKEADYRATIAELRDKLTKAQDQLNKGGGGAISDATGGGSGQEMADLRRRMQEFQINTQRKLERERAALKVQATSAEEELKNFQSYMKSETIKYQKAIMRLQEEGAYWKSLAKSHGADVSRGPSAPKKAAAVGAGPASRQPSHAWRRPAQQV